MSESIPTTKGSRLIPVNRWPEFFPWPSVAGLRWLVFNAERNGFKRAIRRVGRRVLIHEGEFHAWVESQSSSGAGDERASA